MSAPSLKVNIGGVEFKNPILTASGTFGYGEEFDEYIDLSRLGGIVTKSITRHERKGHPPPRTAETASGMLNAIGLANVGVDAYVRDKLPFLRDLGTRIVVNVAGFDIDEYLYVVDKLNGHDEIDMIELNISCPNVKGDGMEFSSNPEIAYDIVRKVKGICGFPADAQAFAECRRYQADCQGLRRSRRGCPGIDQHSLRHGD